MMLRSKHNLMNARGTTKEIGDCCLFVISLVAVCLTAVAPILGVDGKKDNKTEVYCNPYRYKYYHPQLRGCKRCDVCPLGQEIIPWEESNIDIGPNGATKCPSCRPCRDQTFTKRRAFKCRPCKVCGQIQVTKRECTNTHNTVCGKQRRTIQITSTTEDLPTHSEVNAYTSPAVVPQTTPYDKGGSTVTGLLDVATFIIVTFGMVVVVFSIGYSFIFLKNVMCKRKENGNATVQAATVPIEDSQDSCLLPTCIRSNPNDLHLGSEETRPLTQLPINRHDETEGLSTGYHELSNLNQEGDLYEEDGEGVATDMGDSPLSQGQSHYQTLDMTAQGEKMNREMKIKLAEHLAVDNKFERVAKSLGVTSNRIGIIKNDYKGDCNEQAYRILTAWEQKFPTGNKDDIYKALEECGESEIMASIFPR